MTEMTSTLSAEETIRQLEQALVKAEEELQSFAYIASHDLQEPLRKINSFGQRLRDMNADTLDARSLDYLDRMLGASERMQGMLEGLLAFSRVSTYAKPFETVDLQTVVRKLAEQYQKKIVAQHGRIVVDQLPNVLADPAQIWLLFTCLFDNALLFCHEGVPLIVTITAHVETDTVLIHFKDNGIGFNPDKKEQIFQLFQKLHGRQYPGAGMGLAVARRIAERHGGTLVADSQPGMGATFTLSLRRLQGNEGSGEDA